MTGASREWLSRSLLHLLHRAGQCGEGIFLAGMASKMTPRQLAVLITIADNDGLSQTGVVERTGIDRSTMAEIMRRLAKRGLVQRRRSRKDARAYVLELTGEGKRMLRAAEPLARRADAQMLGALPSRQREEFMAALQTMVSKLEGMAATA